MSKQSILDRFSQRVALTGWMVAGADPALAAAYPAPSQFATNWTPKDKMGMLIQQSTFTFRGLEALDAAADRLMFGLCIGNTQPTGGFSNISPSVIDAHEMGYAFATAVGVMGLKHELSFTYTHLVGGGKLCHPASIFAWVKNASSVAWGASVSVMTELHYTLVELNDSDWQEMWQLGYIASQI